MTTSPVGTQHVRQAGLSANHPVQTAPTEYASLSPEGLILFCRSRLQEMDTKIQAKMSDQTELVKLQDAIATIQSDIKAGTAGGGGDVVFDDAATVAAINAKIDDTIDKANRAGKPELAAQLAGVRSALNAGNGGIDSVVTKDEVKSMSTTLDNALSTCRSGAEMSMIELQSLVSKRATQLQLTTGMMSSIDEAPKAIAANIGR